ncbi:unnamed protein product, partial [Staurois parvus]
SPWPRAGWLTAPAGPVRQRGLRPVRKGTYVRRCQGRRGSRAGFSYLLQTRDRRSDMAGKLKAEEARRVLEALSAATGRLGSCLESLEGSQKMLEKSIKCQTHLNHSLKPIQTAFTLKENTSGGLDAASRM